MDFRQEAEKLAARPYTMLVAKDETTKGEPIYVALSLELNGCVAQGDTIEDAVSNLRAAQIDFIQSLLEDDLPVPAPQTQPTLTTSSSVVTFEYVFTPNRPLDRRGPFYRLPSGKNTIQISAANFVS